jgi:hypothetical protein
VLLIFQTSSHKLTLPPEGKSVSFGEEVMKRKWLGLMAISVAVLPILSCAAGQRLVAINVNPTTVTFGSQNPALSAQLTATGVYTHPPATKDLTNQVTWTSSIVGVAVVSSSGVVSPAGPDCGITSITATFKTNNPTGNIITGTMSVTVDGAAPPCPALPI